MYYYLVYCSVLQTGTLCGIKVSIMLMEPDTYYAVMNKSVTAKHIFSVLELFQVEYTETTFLPVPVLFWILSFVVNTIIYRSVILMF
jgi:hypothetical protein